MPQPDMTSPKSTSALSSAENVRNLPIMSLRSKIVKKIMENRITLIVGESGCGKSSQVPQFLLEENIDSILCAQPRRFGVVAVAKMVAKSRNCIAGGEVGYHIGHSRVMSASTKLIFKTAGVLLDEIRDKGMNALRYKVIILDELHQESAESDLVLVCVKQFLIKGSGCRVVLMSATADITRYKEYFGDLGRGEGVEVLGIPCSNQRRVLYLEQGNIYFKPLPTQIQRPLNLTYDERLEEAANFHLGSYFDKVERKLIEINNLNLKLKKFLLNTHYEGEYKSQVTRLIRYAVNSDVQELDISFWSNEGWLYVEIGLDDTFFVNPHLTDLKLSCSFTLPTSTVSWQNLKSLLLSKLRLTEEFIENILSGTPLLETFKLDNCYGDVWEIDIDSNILKNFEISGNRGFRDPQNVYLLLRAPNIISLTIKGSLLLCQLVLLDVHSLVEANLDYNEDDDIGVLSPTEEEEMIFRHLRYLCHVKDLKLGEICSEVRSRLEANGPPKDEYYDEYAEDVISLLEMS